VLSCSSIRSLLQRAAAGTVVDPIVWSIRTWLQPALERKQWVFSGRTVFLFFNLLAPKSARPLGPNRLKENVKTDACMPGEYSFFKGKELLPLVVTD